MEPSLEWKIDLVEWDEATGAIVNVKWHVSVSDGETTATTPGACKFDANPGSDNFIPLDQITEEQVLGWVKKRTPNYLGTEKRAMEKFEAAKKVSSETKQGLPWLGVEIPKVVPKVY